MCEFLWHIIAEEQENKWVKCIILTENENCVKFSGWIEIAIKKKKKYLGHLK